MKTAISVVTAPRPQDVNYLDETIFNLDKEGADFADVRTLHVDKKGHDLENVYSGWHLKFEQCSGIRAMMWSVFAQAIHLGVDRLLFCEDDIRVCKNAIRYMLSLEIPGGAAFIDFYDMREAKLRNLSTAGLHKQKCHDNYWGNQCMLFPVRTLKWLVQCNPFAIHKWELPSHADHCLGHFLAQSPWKEYQFHLPRLVQHVGDVSAAHPGTPRLDRFTVKTLPSDYDAMQLVLPSS